MKSLSPISLHTVTVILFLLLIACSSEAPTEQHVNQPEPADQSHFSDASSINQLLGPGINLGNALEAPSEGDWGMVVEEEFIELIHKAGFGHIRIPVRWNAHAAPSHPYTIDSSLFSRVDEITDWALERGLAVMINLHHYNELMEKPQQHRQRLTGLWEQIASHYKEYPEEVVFEILNEPHDNLTPQLWNQYLAEALQVIRQTNPERVVAIGTANWGGFGTLTELELPESDRQLIATIHYYEPFQFTHQGASWAGDHTDEWLGTAWDETPEEKAAIEEAFDNVLQWAESFDRPIHVGEFGAYSTADEESRIRWTRYVRKSSEARGFSWAYWEFGAGFGIYDRSTGQWRRDLLESLIPNALD